MRKFYRKKIHQWSERYGEDHTVWFYTTQVKCESLDNYRLMTEEELPVPIQERYENRDVVAVIQDCHTNEILKVYE